jgi:hypothetical protein
MRVCFRRVLVHDSTSHRIVSEDDHPIEKATESAISKLVSSEKCEELLDLHGQYSSPTKVGCIYGRPERSGFKSHKAVCKNNFSFALLHDRANS